MRGESAGLRWPRVGDGHGPQTELFDADALAEHHVGRGEYAGYEFLHVNARTIINKVPAASRMPFGHTINVYRGCSHACTYCFARPTHEYLGLGTGLDFERKIVVKVNAVEQLRAELAGRRWAGHHIAMGTNTDPYQRCEGKYRLTRGVVGALADACNPFSILTKSTLVLRDLDVLSAATSRTDVRVNLSIGTLDEDVWRASEPGTPAPRLRVEAVRRLNEAGVACGVLIAPVLPGLSDRPDQLAEVVQAVVGAGAVSVSTVALHLRPGVREEYLRWLAARDPDLAARTQRRYKGSYLPTADQAELTKLVRGLVERSRHPSPASRQEGQSDGAGETDRAGESDGEGPSNPYAPSNPQGSTGYVSPGRIRWVEGRVEDRVRAQMGGDRPVEAPPATEAVRQLDLESYGRDFLDG